MARKPSLSGWGWPKATKPVVEKRKNTYGAESNRRLAREALGMGVCLRFTYDDLPRVVEVHTVGITKADRPAMSAWQVGGQSDSKPVPHWANFCFDECFDVALTDLPSSAPRPDYRKGAKQFKRIDTEL